MVISKRAECHNSIGINGNVLKLFNRLKHLVRCTENNIDSADSEINTRQGRDLHALLGKHFLTHNLI